MERALTELAKVFCKHVCVAPQRGPKKEWSRVGRDGSSKPAAMPDGVSQA